MIRHIFIGTFKEGVSNETKQQQLADMQAMKDKIPGIADLKVGLSTGWAGPTSGTADAYFDRSTFVSAQFEY